MSGCKFSSQHLPIEDFVQLSPACYLEPIMYRLAAGSRDVVAYNLQEEFDDSAFYSFNLEHGSLHPCVKANVQIQAAD
jgi:hypothetical protein